MWLGILYTSSRWRNLFFCPTYCMKLTLSVIMITKSYVHLLILLVCDYCEDRTYGTKSMACGWYGIVWKLQCFSTLFFILSQWSHVSCLLQMSLYCWISFMHWPFSGHTCFSVDDLWLYNVWMLPCSHLVPFYQTIKVNFEVIFTHIEWKRYWIDRENIMTKSFGQLWRDSAIIC